MYYLFSRVLWLQGYALTPNNSIKQGPIIGLWLNTTEFPRLLETHEKPGIYFDSLNPGNSLEICVKTLNPLEICEKQKK